MPLQRMATHRIVRLLQVVLPFIVIGLLVIFGWNYRARRGANLSPLKAAPTLAHDLNVLNEGFSFSRSEGGRMLFTVKARTNLGFQDRKNIFRSVEVIVYGEKPGDPVRRVLSDECSYDEPTGDIRFVRNVVVQLDDKTTARTEELTYNNEARRVASNMDTVIEQTGEMTGRANSLEYALDGGLLKLAGDVRVQLVSGAALETGSAIFHRTENWANVSDGVYLKSGNGWVRGNTGRANLEAGSFKPRDVQIDGNVTAESQSPGTPDIWKSSADSMRVVISSAGIAESVNAQGNVRVERAAAAGDRVLTGDQIDATMDTEGKVSGIAARDNARMTFGADRELSSKVIHSNPAGGVSTDGPSTLKVGDSVIEGRDFEIETGETTTFSTAFRSTSRSGARETAADRTTGRFDGKTNHLLELVQSGNFDFKEGSRRANAQTATITNEGTVITLEGAPVVTDRQMRLEALHIRLNQKDNSFVATDKVKTVSEFDSSPVVVSAALAEGDQNTNTISYTGGVEFWRTDAYIKADRLDVSAQNKTFQAQGNVRSDVQGVRASSDKLDYDDTRQTVHYLGNVKAQKEIRLETSDMVAKVVEGQLSEITAEGNVVVTQGSRRGKGDRALYNAARDQITLIGAQAEVEDPQQGIVRGTQLLMNGNGDKVQVQAGESGRVTSKLKVKK